MGESNTTAHPVVVRVESKHALLAEELDTPCQSLAFLELYHKSALKVENFSKSLQKASYYLGAFAAFCFCWALYSFMSQSAKQAANHHSLKSDGSDATFSTTASSLSMLIWGVVMAKVKSGFGAASSKDHETVKSVFTKVVGMTVLIGIATFAKLNSENHYVENWANSKLQSSQTPRNLKSSNVHASSTTTLTTDEIIAQLSTHWKQEL